MDTKNYTGIHIKNFDLKTENGIFGDLKLFLLLFFHAIGGILWIALNRVPPTWDAALHTMLSFKLLQYIQVHLFQFDIVSFLKISEYYPPFVHFTGIIIALFSGESYKAMQILGLVYFLLSVSVLYFYSFKIFKNKTIAFLSAFFYSFFITNYQQSRDFMLDIPSIFFILSALYLQERSKHFSRTKETIFYSIFIGIAVLTKWTSLFFLILPFLLTLEEGRRIHKDQQFLVLKNILVGVPIVGGICLPWYLVNLQRFIDISKVTSIGELADPQNLLSLQNIFFNINLLSMYQLTYIGAAFFLICLIFFLNSAHKKQIILIGGTIILNYLIFTFISNKNIRYTMPLTPFIAMIMAYGSHKLLTSTSHIAKVASFFIAMWYVISYFILSFGVPIQPNYRIGIKDIDFVYLDSYPVKVLYDNTNWHNTEILNTIYSSSSPAEQGRDITVLNLVDREYMNWYNLDPLLYSSLVPEVRQRVKLSFVPFIEPYKTNQEINRYLNTYIDYALVPQHTIGLAEAIREFIPMQRFQKFILNGESTFAPIASYAVPGNEYYPPDVYILYKKQTSP